MDLEINAYNEALEAYRHANAIALQLGADALAAREKAKSLGDIAHKILVSMTIHFTDEIDDNEYNEDLFFPI